jgi:adenylate kinase family enzyme
MKKIVIVGSPGAGKSTLARALNGILGIEVIHLDKLFWQTGWKKTSREKQIEIQEQLVQKDAWIMDGSYHDTLAIRLNAADTVVFLDMPRLICLGRVIKRYFTERSRADLPNQSRDKLGPVYLMNVWRFPDRDRADLMQQIEDAGKTCTRLCSRSEVADYLQKVRKVSQEVQKEQRQLVEAGFAGG